MKSVTQTRSRVIGFGHILIGLIFLANPYFNLLDILPDAIGYLLILRGLGACLWTIPSFEEAVKQAKILIGISLIRMVALFFVASMPQAESPTMSLAAVFCLVLAEGYFGLRLITEAFRGIQYTVLCGDCMEMDRGLRFLRVITRLMLFFRLLGNLLPELAVLGVTEEGYVGSVTENETQIWLQLRNVLTVLLFLLVLIGSVGFVLAWASWLRRARRNEAYLSALEAEIRANPEPYGHKICRTAESGTLLLTVGMALLWAVRLDGYVFVPSFLGVCLIAISCGSFLQGHPSFRTERRLWFACAPLFFLSWLSQNLFAERHYVTGSARGGEVWFYVNIALACLCSAAAVLLLVRLSARLRAYVDAHCFPKIDPALTRTVIEVENQKQRLKARLRVLALTCAIPAVLDGIEAATLFAPEIHISVLGAAKAIPFWGIFVLLRLGWIAFACLTVRHIKVSAEEKYNEER